MQEFQSIMRSSSVEQAELTCKEACDFSTSKKYGKLRIYLQSHLLGGEQICVAIIPTTMQRLECDCTKS